MKPFTAHFGRDTSNNYGMSPNTRFVCLEIKDTNNNGLIDSGDKLRVAIESQDDGVDQETTVELTAKHAESASQLGQLINGTFRESGISNKEVRVENKSTLVVYSDARDGSKKEQIRLELD